MVFWIWWEELDILDFLGEGFWIIGRGGDVLDVLEEMEEVMVVVVLDI